MSQFEQKFPLKETPTDTFYSVKTAHLALFLLSSDGLTRTQKCLEKLEIESRLSQRVRCRFDNIITLQILRKLFIVFFQAFNPFIKMKYM